MTELDSQWAWISFCIDARGSAVRKMVNVIPATYQSDISYTKDGQTITKDLTFMSSEFQKKSGAEKVLNGIMAEKSPNLTKDRSLQMQEAE